jgi:hypothetical protein
MADYRFYHLSTRRIMSAEVHDCADDAAAQIEARRIIGAAMPYCDAIEIWQLTRLVGIVRRAGGDDTPTPREGA